MDWATYSVPGWAAFTDVDWAIFLVDPAPPPAAGGVNQDFVGMGVGVGLE